MQRYIRLFLLVVLILGAAAISICSVNAAASLTIETPREAYYRGEVVILTVNCTNNDTKPISKAIITAKTGKWLSVSTNIGELPAGSSVSKAIKIQTSGLKTGKYNIEAVFLSNNSILSQASCSLYVGKRPNPEALMVRLWGGGGDKWYMEHGFSTCGIIDYERVEAGKFKEIDKIMTDCMMNGGLAGLFPNGGLREIAVSDSDDPDMKYNGLYRPENVANPFNPEVAKRQNAINQRLMEVAKKYPQIKSAFVNTEIIDNMVNNHNKQGLQLMLDNLGSTSETFGAPKIAAPGVIADDDPYYIFHKYKYTIGKGLNEANKRAVDMIKRYRPDIMVINDPYRETAFYDVMKYVDIVSTWQYTNPDPKLIFYNETMRAVCKPTGQIPLTCITMLNYPGELAPTDVWMLMDSGRVKVTSWINLSRAPKIVEYYYSSECPPENTDTVKTPYETSKAIKQIADKVYKPYGSMLTQLEVSPRKVAVLSSESSRLYGKSPNSGGYYNNSQIYSFYTVMAMAHINADVIFDETIERYGLDDYDVLVLARCDMLKKGVYDKIIDFSKKGGIIIIDQYIQADIPGAIKFDFDFTYRDKVTANAIAKNIAYAKWNDQLQPDSAELVKVEGVTALDDQKLLEAYSAKLKEGLKGKVEPDISADSPKVLMNTLEKDGVKYLVVINDNRVYDDRVGKYKAVLGKVVPISTNITIKGWSGSLNAYDMLEMKPLALTNKKGNYSFNLDLSELGGKIIALYPVNIKSMNLIIPDKMALNKQYNIGIEFRDIHGNVLPGLQPIKVTITDPEGKINESSDYYCAKAGYLALSFTPALNDTPGKWKIAVTDLTSGIKTVKYCVVVK